MWPRCKNERPVRWRVGLLTVFIGLRLIFRLARPGVGLPSLQGSSMTCQDGLCKCQNRKRRIWLAPLRLITSAWVFMRICGSYLSANFFFFFFFFLLPCYRFISPGTFEKVNVLDEVHQLVVSEILCQRQKKEVRSEKSRSTWTWRKSYWQEM